jgi:hypothetical protein
LKLYSGSSSSWFVENIAITAHRKVMGQCCWPGASRSQDQSFSGVGCSEKLDPRQAEGRPTGCTKYDWRFNEAGYHCGFDCGLCLFFRMTGDAWRLSTDSPFSKQRAEFLTACLISPSPLNDSVRLGRNLPWRRVWSTVLYSSHYGL